MMCWFYHYYVGVAHFAHLSAQTVLTIKPVKCITSMSNPCCVFKLLVLQLNVMLLPCLQKLCNTLKTMRNNKASKVQIVERVSYFRNIVSVFHDTYQTKNTLLQLKVLLSKCYISKSTEALSTKCTAALHKAEHFWHFLSGSVSVFPAAAGSCFQRKKFW